MFPQEVDVINIALILPVFSAAVVKATSVWVLCVFGNSRSGGMGEAVVCTHGCVHVRTMGVVFSAQPWWADVMHQSGPCLRSFLALARSQKVSGYSKSLAHAVQGSPTEGCKKVWSTCRV